MFKLCCFVLVFILSPVDSYHFIEKVMLCSDVCQYWISCILSIEVVHKRNGHPSKIECMISDLINCCLYSAFYVYSLNNTAASSNNIDFLKFHPHTRSQQQQLGSLEISPVDVEPERLTPHKFTSNHCAASFESGVLVCVKQKYLPNHEIQNNVNILKFGTSK